MYSVGCLWACTLVLRPNSTCIYKHVPVPALTTRRLVRRQDGNADAASENKIYAFVYSFVKVIKV